VIGPVIDTHVLAAWHVALDTISASAHLKEHLAITRFDRLSLFTLLFVKVMPFGVILTGPMALKTDLISLFEKLNAMHVVAVTAAHVTMVHLALCERAVDVDLVEDLSIRMVEILFQQRRHHAIQQLPLLQGSVRQENRGLQ